MAVTAQLLQDSLLAVWNDRNSNNRLEAMKKIYASNIQFFENNLGDAIVGHQAINQLIANLQASWAPEFIFALTKPAQSNHSIQMAEWKLGIPGSAPVATGHDVAVIEQGLIKLLYLFLDAQEDPALH